MSGLQKVQHSDGRTVVSGSDAIGTVRIEFDADDNLISAVCCTRTQPPKWAREAVAQSQGRRGCRGCGDR